MSDGFKGSANHSRSMGGEQQEGRSGTREASTLIRESGGPEPGREGGGGRNREINVVVEKLSRSTRATRPCAVPWRIIRACLQARALQALAPSHPPSSLLYRSLEFLLSFFFTPLFSSFLFEAVDDEPFKPGERERATKSSANKRQYLPID